MSFDRRWLEDSGSEDSHGRTLWALGECARSDANASRRRWAAALVRRGLAGGGELPLAARLGLRAARAWMPIAQPCRTTLVASAMRQLLADRLVPSWRRSRPRIGSGSRKGLPMTMRACPRRLIVTGLATGEPRYIEAGLRTLRWLMTLQTAPAGLFRPVGTDGFGDSASSRSLSISSRWRRRRRSRPALRPGAPMAMPRGRPTPRAHSPGSSASNDLSVAAGRRRDRQLPRWAASRPRQTKTAAANLWSPICSASRRSGSSPARAASAPRPRRMLVRDALELCDYPTTTEPRAPCHKPHS